MRPSHKKSFTNCLIAFACCLIALAGAYLIIQRINQASQQIRQTKENLANWDKKEAYFRELSIEREKISPNLIAINQGFLNPEQIVQFIKELEDLSRDSQISQEIKTIQKVEEPTPSLTLNLNLETTFKQTLRYLARLESLQYFNKLDKIQMISGATKIAANPENLNLENPEAVINIPLIKTTLEFTIFLIPKK